MKTAEEWADEPIFEFARESGILRVEFISAIRKIQLDARKQGYTEAADKVEYWRNCHVQRLRSFPNTCCIQSEIKDCAELRSAILRDRDNLK